MSSDERLRYAAHVQDARDYGSIISFMSAKKIGTAMWVLRIYTMILSIQYMFFCSAFNMGQFFTRAMIANGIICALRLHERVPEFRLTRQHFGQIMSEDSGHYLVYTVIFLLCHPITIAMVPVTVFALLHLCSFTRQMIDVHGSNSYPMLRKVINHIAKNQGTLFRFIAMNEIIIFPTTIAMVIAGRANFLVPFLYYRFLTYRYLSRRNPYCRLTFYELRRSLEYMTRNAACPSILGSLIFKLIEFTLRLSPSMSAFQGQTTPSPDTASSQTTTSSSQSS